MSELVTTRILKAIQDFTAEHGGVAPVRWYVTVAEWQSIKDENCQFHLWGVSPNAAGFKLAGVPLSVMKPGRSVWISDEVEVPLSDRGFGV